MSNCTIPTIPINSTDAVGDSAGKHNYNSLVLDTNICNLSSQLFLNYNNVYTIFQKLTSYIDTFVDVAPHYTDERVYQMSQVNTTVRLLSSYWNKQEFSVQYPINAAILNDLTDTINAPTLSAVDAISIVKSVNSRLKPLALSYINLNFPATNFMDGTIVNVVFFLFNISPNPVDPNHLIVFKASPNIYSYNSRAMEVSFTRDTIYFTKGVNLKFYKQNNIWNFLGYDSDKFRDSIPLTTKPTNPVKIKPTFDIPLPTKILKSRIYNSNSTFIPPSDVTKVLVLLVGGGGGGGGGMYPNAGGGGGGGEIVLTTQTVTPGFGSYNIVVGQGGAAGLNGTNGGDGYESKFATLSSRGGFHGFSGNPSYITHSFGGDPGGFGGGGGGHGFTTTQGASAGQDGFLYNDAVNYPTGTYFSGGGGGGGEIDDEISGGSGGGGIGSGPIAGDGIANSGGGGGGGTAPSTAGTTSGGKGGTGLVAVLYYTAT